MNVQNIMSSLVTVGITLFIGSLITTELGTISLELGQFSRTALLLVVSTTVIYFVMTLNKEDALDEFDFLQTALDNTSRIKINILQIIKDNKGKIKWYYYPIIFIAIVLIFLCIRLYL